MNVEITRPSEDEIYSVTLSYGAGTRPGVSRSQLRQWLRELGTSESQIENVFSLGPNQSITIEVPDEPGEQWAAAG